MAIRISSIDKEIYQMYKTGPKPIINKWGVEVHTPQGIYKPFKMMSLDIDRNYVDNIGDVMFVELAFGRGDYQSRILPFSSDLMIKLIQYPLIGNGGDSQDLNRSIKTQLYRAITLDDSSKAVESNYVVAGSHDGNNESFIDLYTFQLIDIALEQTRLQSFGTVFRGVTAGDAIKYSVSKVAQQLQVDSSNAIEGIDMVEPDNTKVFSQIIVPHGTVASDVPSYISDNYGMPYVNGFATYLQQGLWYIYPLYDLKRYDKAKKTLTLIANPPNQLPDTDRSYRVTANQVIIVATGRTVHKNPTDSLQLNLGNGVRYSSASKTIDSFVSNKDNKATASRYDNASEYKLKKRPGGMDRVSLSSSRITDNVYKEMSKLASRMGSLMTVVWDHANPSLIFPGMPCRYLYQHENELFELKGTVIKTQSQTAPITDGLMDSPYNTSMAITLFVNGELNWYNDSQASA